MASFFSNVDNGIDLEARIAQLSKELAGLKKVAARRGASAYADGLGIASDVYDELRDRFDEALPHIRRGARSIERGARDNPAMAAFVGLVVIGALAALLVRR